jgi:hypothetical protein
LFLFFTATLSKVKSTLDKLGIDENAKATVLKDISDHNLFSGLESSHMRQQYYKKEFHLVEPVKMILGSKRKAKGYGSKRRTIDKKDTMVYIPILKTLQSMLNNISVRNEINRSHCTIDPEVLSDYCDGDVFKSHPIFSKHTKSFQILLYYDDVEICNPLGSKKSIHKLGIFYFTLANLRPKLRSKFTAIQLAIICKKSVIDEYSIDRVLRPLIEDIKKLEEGYEFHIESSKETYYGTIALISADNPASSALGGFKEGSSAYRYCRHCLGKAEDTIKEFNESSFKIRNLTRHMRHCDKIKVDISASKKYGVNRHSILLELKYFDMCSGTLITDVMHDVLEGVLQYEAKLLPTVNNRITGTKWELDTLFYY